jgi:hypothetical protein
MLFIWQTTCLLNMTKQGNKVKKDKKRGGEMKKLFVFMCVTVSLLFLFNNANALPVPFQIDGGTLNVDWDSGGGIVGYTPSVMGSPVLLNEAACAAEKINIKNR